ncbi:MAG TPA: alpha/beta hydrolase [Jatrophihabitantaceae bacterium]|jgi:dienelactone hydrolase
MDHLAELKEFARLHAGGQGLTAAQVGRVLRHVHDDEPGSPRSWARVWTAEGDALAARGETLAACQHYTLARFPYPGDPERVHAQQRAVAAFDEWRTGTGGIERLTLHHPAGSVAAWAAGLDARRPRPLLVVMGGIVSVKEQWAQALPAFAKLGFAAVVSEMPGVGENTLQYGPDSWRLLPWLVNQFQGRADTNDVSMLTLSFSGNLALRAAVDDPRIRRILTVGAPVSRFFTDESWWHQAPRITKDTLARLSGTPDHDSAFATLRGLALDAPTLSAIRVPVRYVVSRRDEIIPAADPELLAAAAPRAKFRRFDDVHGSPAHLNAMRRWLVLSLLRLRAVDRFRRARVAGPASPVLTGSAEP